MAKKEEAVKGTTPAGVAVWPYLNKPDEYKGQKAYKTGLRLSEDGAAILIAKLEPLVDTAHDEAIIKLKDKIANGKDGKTKASAKKALESLTKSYPWTDDVDDEGEPTGDVIFKFKSSAEYEDKKTGQMKKITIPLFDSRNKETKALIGNGSVIRISYMVSPFHMDATGLVGISLRINGVQIKELSSGSFGASASQMGFEEDEDGFDGSDITEEDMDDGETGKDADDQSSDDEDDF